MWLNFGPARSRPGDHAGMVFLRPSNAPHGKIQLPEVVMNRLAGKAAGPEMPGRVV